MKKRRLEETLRNAVSHATPDKLDDILSACDRQKGTVIPMTNQKKNRSLITRVAGIAAAIVLLVAGGGLGLHLYQTQAVASTVILDVNPSITLEVNRKDEVLNVLRGNADGEKVIGDMNLVGADVQVAVNAIVGSMLQQGYLSNNANSILISVDSENDQRAVELKKTLVNGVDAVMKNTSSGGAVLSQTMRMDETIRAMMAEYNISAGKAKLIQRIVKSNTAYTEADLAVLNINELNLLSNSGKHPAQDVDSQGVASQGQYIGAERAKEIALTHAQVDVADVWDLEAELEAEKGKLVYEVSFDCGDYEYDYEIDAQSGEIVKSKKKEDKKASAKPDNAQKPDQQLPDNVVGETAAKQAAFAHANVKEADVKKLVCKEDFDDGKWIYEIEFVSGDYEYEYEVDAQSGLVVSFDREREEDVKEHRPSQSTQQTKPTTPNAKVDEAAVKQTVLAHANVNETDVRGFKCKLDRDDGRLVYEVEFVAGGFEYDYEVDAETGTILQSEKERDD